MERYLFGSKTPHQAIRIARQGGVPATRNIQMHASRLSRMASYGKYGGYVLAGVGVAASCKQIADADSRLEKNEIIVEALASTLTGVLGSYAITLFLISSPVGWGTALVLATGSVAASYSAGRLARKGYTMSGSEVDFVSGLGIDSLCY